MDDLGYLDDCKSDLGKHQQYADYPETNQAISNPVAFKAIDNGFLVDQGNTWGMIHCTQINNIGYKHSYSRREQNQPLPFVYIMVLLCYGEYI